MCSAQQPDIHGHCREAWDFSWSEQDETNNGVLEITVWDKDVGSKDDFMGR